MLLGMFGIGVLVITCCCAECEHVYLNFNFAHNNDSFYYNHMCTPSISTPWKCGHPLFQPPVCIRENLSEMRTLLYTVEPFHWIWGYLYTVELIYSISLKWQHLCVQWNSFIPFLWNDNTSIYSEISLFQSPEMAKLLYTVKPLYSNPLKWQHLCIQWKLSILTHWKLMMTPLDLCIQYCNLSFTFTLHSK